MKDPVSVEQKSQIELKAVCESCHKPVRTLNKASLTGWIFSASTCKCSRSEREGVGVNKDDAAGEIDAGRQRGIHKAVAPPPVSIETPAELRNVVVPEKYVVLQLLGVGGMGSVYKVKDQSLGMTLALKLMRPDLVEEPEAVARFQQEAQAAQLLTHPHLVSTYEHGVTTEGRPYLVMEYVAGKTLAEIIADEVYLDVEPALDLFVQIAQAMAYAQSMGIVHRDLKPGNIMISTRGGRGNIAKIVDFGISKMLVHDTAEPDLTKTGDVIGTPSYMSPEQCRGEELDARSDIYSFGCLMYEALTGKPPFGAQSPMKTILKHLREMPSRFSEKYKSLEIPHSLEELVFRCLVKDPDKRYQDFHEIGAHLTYLSESAGKAVLPRRSTRPASKWLQNVSKRMNMESVINPLLPAAVLAILIVSPWLYASAANILASSGRCLANANLPEEGRFLINSAIATYPQAPYPYAVRANVGYLQGRLAEARKDSDMAQKLGGDEQGLPSWPFVSQNVLEKQRFELMSVRAALLDATGDHRAALAEIKASKKYAHSQDEIGKYYLLLAKIENNLGDHEQALLDISNSHCPNHPLYYSEQARALVNLNKSSLALGLMSAVGAVPLSQDPLSDWNLWRARAFGVMTKLAVEDNASQRFAPRYQVVNGMRTLKLCDPIGLATKAIESSPNSAWTHYNRSVVWEVSAHQDRQDYSKLEDPAYKVDAEMFLPRR